MLAEFLVLRSSLLAQKILSESEHNIFWITNRPHFAAQSAVGFSGQDFTKELALPFQDARFLVANDHLTRLMIHPRIVSKLLAALLQGLFDSTIGNEPQERDEHIQGAGDP